MKILNNFIENLYTGDGIAVNGLRLVPLFIKEERLLPYLELEEALRQNMVEITEVSEQGSVPNLQVTNKSLRDILILDGEELIGAKQNRIVNTTIVVPAHSSVVTPVSCVEQGRWRYTSKEFSTGDSFSYPSLRRQKHRDVTSSLRSTGSYTADQSRIWDDISMKSARMHVTSDTMAMSDIFESRTEGTEHLEKDVPHQEKQVGFFAFIDHGFAGGDVFGSVDLCRRKLPKLVRSYYLDSLDEGVKFPAITVEQILAQIQSVEPEQFASIGKGTEVRFESQDVQGACKVVDDFIPHLMVFPKN
ncbi:MAG TPA: DUF6569 family protein [Pyrinomonadaceae bacterium]|jgi:hypothetical protein